jgi:hypothetical protein
MEGSRQYLVSEIISLYEVAPPGCFWCDFGGKRNGNKINKISFVLSFRFLNTLLR